MSGNEKGVIDAFNEYMHEAAHLANVKYQPLSLGSADKNLADYLLSADSRYVLVEFKDSESDLNSERSKPKRHVLCKKLEIELEVAKLHDRCHFVAWAGGTDDRLWMNIYRHEICNCKRMGLSSSLASQLPKFSERLGADTFAGSFFAKISTRGLAYAQLRSYVAWLCEVQGGRESVELIMRKKGTAAIRRFGLDELQRELDQSPGPVAQGSGNRRSSSRPR